MPQGRQLVSWLEARRVRIVTAFYCLGFFLLGCCIASLGPALEELSRRTGMTLDSGAVGVIVTARSLGYLAASVLAGVVLDRRPAWGNRMITIGLVLCGFSTAAITFIRSFPLLLALMSFNGLCMGQLDVCANVLIGHEFDHPHQCEPYMQALHASFALGAALAPVFVTQLMLQSPSKASFDVPFYAIAALFVPAIVLGVFVCLLSTRQPPSSSSSSSSSDELQHKEEEEENQDIESSKPSSTSSTSSSHVQLQGRLSWVFVGLLSFMLCLYVGSEVAVGLYIFTFASRVTLMSISASGYLNTLFWSVFAAGRIISVVISALRIPPRTMVLFSVAGTALFAAIPIFLYSIQWTLWLCVALLGLCMAPMFPSVYNWCALHVPLSGRISATFVVCSAAGEMLFPLLVGFLFGVSWAGFKSLFPVVTMASLVGLACTVVSLILVARASSTTGYVAPSMGKENDSDIALTDMTSSTLTLDDLD